jgi:hypothetical protein
MIFQPLYFLCILLLDSGSRWWRLTPIRSFNWCPFKPQALSIKAVKDRLTKTIDISKYREYDT